MIYFFSASYLPFSPSFWSCSRTEPYWSLLQETIWIPLQLSRMREFVIAAPLKSDRPLQFLSLPPALHWNPSGFWVILPTGLTSNWDALGAVSVPPAPGWCHGNGGTFRLPRLNSVPSLRCPTSLWPACKCSVWELPALMPQRHALNYWWRWRRFPFQILVSQNQPKDEKITAHLYTLAISNSSRRQVQNRNAHMWSNIRVEIQASPGLVSGCLGPSVCCQITEDYCNLDSENKSKVHITLCREENGQFPHQGGGNQNLLFWTDDKLSGPQFPHNLLSIHLVSGPFWADLSL